MMGQKIQLGVEEQPSARKAEQKAHTGAEDGLDYAAFRSRFEQGDGVIMMAIRDIFRQTALEPDKRFSVSCSFLEIYNDVVHDLLTTTDKLSDELPIVEMNVNPSLPTE
jgi:hypothetical protein